MKTAVLACETIRCELVRALEDTSSTYPVYWLDSGLHNTPNVLRSRLSETIAKAESDGVGRLLAAMGFCGNSFTEVATGHIELILPRVDDCITLLLGSIQRRRELSETYAAYFLTHGWMRGERNIWVEYQHMVSKYGEDVARDIAGTMFGNYRTLMLLDSGTEPIEQLVESTEIVAETLHLEQKVAPATRDYLAELLRGPWDDEHFVVVSPGSIITAKDLMLTRTECQR